MKKTAQTTLTAISAALVLAFAVAPAPAAAATPAQEAREVRKDFYWKGSIDEVTVYLAQTFPGWGVLPTTRRPTTEPFRIEVQMRNATATDVFREIGEMGGDVVDVVVYRNMRDQQYPNGYIQVVYRDTAKPRITGSFTVTQAQAPSAQPLAVAAAELEATRAELAKQREAARIAELKAAAERQERERIEAQAKQRPAPAVVATGKGKGKPGTDLVPDEFDFRFRGDIQGALRALADIQPGLTIQAPAGQVQAIPVNIDVRGVSLVEAFKVIDEQAGDRANIVYSAKDNRARVSFRVPSEHGTAVVEESKRFQNGGTARPVLGADGLLQFPYGEFQPEITCAPLRACVIELQAGEMIKNVVMGDTVRWQAAPATTGEGSMAIPNVIIKPTAAGLHTNLVITTNKRTYILTLKSSEVNYVSRAGFYYPRDLVQNWTDLAETARRQAEEDDKRKVSDLPGVSPDQINFDYKVSGDRDLDWHPVRVFDDGTRVFIQMPASMRSNEAPALILLGKDGKSELVNYRVKDSYYIVDKLFTKAALIVGVGSDQQKVEITNSKKSKGSSFSLFGNTY